VRAGLPAPFGPLRVALPSQHARAVFKEALDLVEEGSCGDSLPRAEYLPGLSPGARSAASLALPDRNVPWFPMSSGSVWSLRETRYSANLPATSVGSGTFRSP